MQTQPKPHAEAFASLPNGIELCYDTFGDRSKPALLLIMGLGGPLTWWHPQLCQRLADAGFFVVRYDNRDVGRSTRLQTATGGRGRVIRTFVRPGTPVPYTISDMADDAAALLDQLDIRQAHVAGVSMGGFIAQTLAIEHPERVDSLTSIMSSTGARSVGWQHPRLFPMLLRRESSDRDGYIDGAERIWSMIGSPGYPTSAEETRARAGETFDRGVSVRGVLRQMQAVLVQRDRSAALHDLDVPTLVIHGLSDRMVHSSGGRATARAVPGAELLLIPGMGHDLPRQLWPVFVSGIARTANRAGAAAGTPTDERA